MTQNQNTLKKTEDVLHKCQACKADVVWMKTTKGKLIPVDLSEKVKLFLNFTTPRPLTFNPKTMTSHFATCSFAASFRKKKK